jgi:hypothetical protein
VSVIKLRAVADADGRIRLDLPAPNPGLAYDIQVILHPVGGYPPGATPEERGWPPGYFEQTYGSITDPEFKIAPRGIATEDLPG